MNDENTAPVINSSSIAETLPAELVSLVKTEALLNNVRSLEVKNIEDFSTDTVATICSGQNLAITGKPIKTTFIPLLTGAIERLNQGYDNSVILIITPNPKCNNTIYDLITKLCQGTDIIHANCSSRNSKRDLDTRLFVGSYDTILRAVQGGKIPGIEVSLIVFPQLDSTIESIDVEQFAELFSIPPQKPQIVYTSSNQNSSLQEFNKQYLPEFKEITIKGQDTMVEHTYAEVGSDLLDKTNALSDIIETSNVDGVLVYCNSDSDTDLVQVILRKRGFEVASLLSDRAEREDSKNPQEIMRQVSEKEITAVITNDSAIDNIDLDHFDLVIYYGIPQDPNLYMSRIGADATPAKLNKVISLVSPLDFTHFHVIKKALAIPLNTTELPAKEQVMASKITRLVNAAQKGDYSKDERITQLLPLIIDNPNRDSIISMLLHNTLTLIPELKKAKETNQRSTRPERSDRYDRDNDRRDNRRDDRRGGNRRDRGDWEDRDDEPRGRRETSPRGGDREDRGGRYPRERRGSDRGRSNDEGSNNYDDNRPSNHRISEPPKRDVRFYIGQGSKDGFSKEILNGLVSEHCGLSDADVKRLSIRSRYSFADFSEENAPAIIEKLAGTTLGGGTQLFIKKATVINTPRERDESSDSTRFSQNDGDQDGSTVELGEEKMEGGIEDSNGDNYQL